MASPKHPQSLTGLAIHSHSDTTVMKAISSRVSRDTVRRWMAISRKTPRQNSKADSRMESVRAIHSGIRPGSDSALR